MAPLKPPRNFRLHYVWLLLALSACGPKRPVIPDDIETIARGCYETLVTPERTPKLRPSESMEDGTFLILWSMTEFPNERGSCTVDGSGTVLLLTSNADETDANEPPSADTEQPSADKTPE
ncbi:hypothetical protein IQ260_16375 [Leptolyngbya cf. ectocarpi LEGE 11479]|uniref:Uncharacterized protein n=1 Tax=Leptolyngbya cf. ectocarpi LEGE 11479 TaxID=1828722 RepID=A0A929FAW5_LEPEC|nr:hypothetical protein [Leptolyngbya ectocarpi]MBE9068228.1 hypothetical protein [Leptolyngbya cf. ectocarpi LEGE 11479]